MENATAQMDRMARAQHARFLPIVREISSDLLTPVTALLRLRAQGASCPFLLESAEGGERIGRYSYLGINPVGSVSVVDGVLSCSGPLQKPADDEPIFKRIGNMVSALRGPAIPGLPGFCGGMVGFIGYDAAAYLERLPKPLCAVGTPDIRLKLYSEVIIFDHLRHRLTLVVNVDLEACSLEEGKKDAEARLAALAASLCRPCPQEIPLILSAEGQHAQPEPLRGMMGESRFCQAVKEAKEHIRCGDIFQVVLSDRFSRPYPGDPLTAYRALRAINPSPYLYYLDSGEEALVGSSPEMLLSAIDGNLETHPIAGTRPRGATADEDRDRERSLLRSVKERAEHLMLVDLGRNDIGRIALPGTVEVPEFMAIKRYSHVMHLVSRVTGRRDPRFSPMEALGACFPAGTLTGAPKIRAMEIIAALEGEGRGSYGGAIVFADFAGNLNSCIAIRTMVIKNGLAHVQAGAGIVADSRAEREYAEVQQKAAAVLRALALAGFQGTQASPEKSAPYKPARGGR